MRILRDVMMGEVRRDGVVVRIEAAASRGDDGFPVRYARGQIRHRSRLSRSDQEAVARAARTAAGLAGLDATGFERLLGKG